MSYYDIDNQISDAEKAFDDENVDLTVYEREKTYELTNKLIILFLGVMKLNYLDRRKALNKAKTEISKYHYDLEKEYLKTFNIDKKEKILGYTVGEMLYSINNDGYNDIAKDIKSGVFNIDKLDGYFSKKSGKRNVVKDTLKSYVYEKSKDNEKSSYGWVSVAVLDKRTSNICKSLNGAFYSGKKYKTRSSIPNRPPRHFKCRSTIVKVYNEKDKKKLIS